MKACFEPNQISVGAFLGKKLLTVVVEILDVWVASQYSSAFMYVTQLKGLFLIKV